MDPSSCERVFAQTPPRARTRSRIPGNFPDDGRLSRAPKRVLARLTRVATRGRRRSLLDSEPQSRSRAEAPPSRNERSRAERQKRTADAADAQRTVGSSAAIGEGSLFRFISTSTRKSPNSEIKARGCVGRPEQVDKDEFVKVRNTMVTSEEVSLLAHVWEFASTDQQIQTTKRVGRDDQLQYVGTIPLIDMMTGRRNEDPTSVTHKRGEDASPETLLTTAAFRRRQKADLDPGQRPHPLRNKTLFRFVQFDSRPFRRRYLFVSFRSYVLLRGRSRRARTLTCTAAVARTTTRSRGKWRPGGAEDGRPSPLRSSFVLSPQHGPYPSIVPRLEGPGRKFRKGRRAAGVPGPRGSPVHGLNLLEASSSVATRRGSLSRRPRGPLELEPRR